MTPSDIPKSSGTGVILNRSRVTEARLPLRAEHQVVLDEWWIFDADDLAVAGPLTEEDVKQVVLAEVAAFSTSEREE